MRIKLDGYEPAHELRALSAMLLVLADHRGEDRYSVKLDPVPLSDGDAPTQFVGTDTTADTMTIRPIAPDESTVTIAGVAGFGPLLVPESTLTLTKPKRTRAARAATQLSLVPTAPVAVEVAPEAPPTPLVPAAPPALAEPSPVTPMVQVAAPVAPTTPVVPALPPQASAVPGEPKTFPELMRALSSALASKRLTGDALNAACAANGATNLQGLLQQPALVPAVYAAVLAGLGGAL